MTRWQFPAPLQDSTHLEAIAQVAVKAEGILEVQFFSGLREGIGDQGETPERTFPAQEPHATPSILYLRGDLFPGKETLLGPKAVLQQSSSPIWCVLSVRRATPTAVS